MNESVSLIGAFFAGMDVVVVGGGIFSQTGMVLFVTNSTICGNTATSGPGGGIINSGLATVTNSTISGNTATTGGGGITAQGTETLVNTVIAGNTARATR